MSCLKTNKFKYHLHNTGWAVYTDRYISPPVCHQINKNFQLKKKKLFHINIQRKQDKKNDKCYQIPETNSN